MDGHQQDSVNILQLTVKLGTAVKVNFGFAEFLALSTNTVFRNTLACPTHNSGRTKNIPVIVANANLCP